MTGGLDPTVLQLFTEKRQPLDAEQFVVQIAARLEREERRHHWCRYVGLSVVLAVAGLSIPWMLRGISLLARELAG